MLNLYPFQIFLSSLSNHSPFIQLLLYLTHNSATLITYSFLVSTCSNSIRLLIGIGDENNLSPAPSPRRLANLLKRPNPPPSLHLVRGDCRTLVESMKYYYGGEINGSEFLYKNFTRPDNEPDDDLQTDAFPLPLRCYRENRENRGRRGKGVRNVAWIRFSLFSSFVGGGGEGERLLRNYCSLIKCKLHETRWYRMKFFSFFSFASRGSRRSNKEGSIAGILILDNYLNAIFLFLIL